MRCCFCARKKYDGKGVFHQKKKWMVCCSLPARAYKIDCNVKKKEKGETMA